MPPPQPRVEVVVSPCFYCAVWTGAVDDYTIELLVSSQA